MDVSLLFKPFCGQIIKACLVGGMTSRRPQKLIFPATKYTAPADEAVITEPACSAEVTPSGDKGAGAGVPLERAGPLFPSLSACLLILILLGPKVENRSPFVLPPDLCLEGCWAYWEAAPWRERMGGIQVSDSNRPTSRQSDFTPLV